MGNLPSRRKEKKTKHRSSQFGVVKPNFPVLPIQDPSVQILNVDLEPKDPPSVQISSTINVSASSQTSRQVTQNLIENEDLAWERFKKVVIDRDLLVCYGMSLKDFEHSGVHYLFKVCELFFFFLISSYQ